MVEPKHWLTAMNNSSSANIEKRGMFWFIVLQSIVHRHMTGCPSPYDRLSIAKQPVVYRHANISSFSQNPTNVMAMSIKPITSRLAELE